MPKLNRLFIANRGEICARIAATAQRMGIETVAITDRLAPASFLSSAVTEFIRVEEESLALYLDGPKLIQLAREAHCDSLHPGFGFLSENARFAELVEQSGLTWIGPSPGAIDKMASKATARSLALAANVPCVPGMQDFHVPESETGDFSKLEAFATKAGFPLIIKAALGGGGKGMRLVRSLDELRAATLRAHSEAKSSFGDGSLIIERYVESPRHVEVQILADSSGNVYAIGDRDCSVQRRHQKILEEAPAPDINPKLRQDLHSCAVSLAKAVNYRSAGTVEFLLDESMGRDNQNFYFLEMNTRLQVEHPVTEEVYGLDLVEWQLRVAMGETLPDYLSDLKPRGHSIEARLYAEDVDNDFFPAPGPIFGFLPAMLPGVRWEIGIDTVDLVSTKFDPMVAKVIATGPDRPAAIAKLAQAMMQTFFAAPASNREFLIDICTKTEFNQRAVGTHFIADHSPGIFALGHSERGAIEPYAKAILATLEKSGGQLAQSRTSFATSQHIDIKDHSFSIRSHGRPLGDEPGAMLVAAESTWAIPGIKGLSAVIGHGSYRQELQYLQFTYSVGNYGGQTCYTVNIRGRQFTSLRELRTGWSGMGSQVQGSHQIVAPVPGKVVKVGVKSGVHVNSGTSAFVLESMKMEFEVKTQRAGTIGTVQVKEGDQVTTGDLLAIWADEQSDT